MTLDAINYNRNKFPAFLLFFTFCFQCTDVKIGYVKISELLLLLVGFFIIEIKIHYLIRYFFTLFFLLLLKTIFLNSFYDFSINAELPFLKEPYFVSIGRFLELLCCIIFAQVTYLFFKGLSYDYAIVFLKKLAFIQVFYLGVPFIIIYLLTRFEFISLASTSPFVYNTQANYGYLPRLAGFYVEGGPLGLYFAFIYIIFDNFYKSIFLLRIAGLGILLFIITFAAQSKAGITLLSIWYLSRFAIYFFSFKNSRKLFLYILPVLLLIFFGVFYKITEMYRGTYSLLSDKTSVFYNREDLDKSTVMGRVAGVIIVPNMIAQNPVLGIGLGNYPLMRNNTNYRESLPPIHVDDWDAHGLGGVVDIIVDGGLLFFLSFLVIIWLIYREVKSEFLHFLPLFICFIGPFLCGVQVYFLYPWFAMGCLASFIEKNKQSDFFGLER